MINLYRKFSKILLIKYHWLKLLWRTLNERRNAGIIIGIITQRCLKQIKTDNHKRNGRKHIGEITVLPIMSLTPYYTEVISLSVSSVQPDLKKGKTTRVEGDGTRKSLLAAITRNSHCVEVYTRIHPRVQNHSSFDNTLFMWHRELTKLKTEGKCRDIKREKKKER